MATTGAPHRLPRATAVPPWALAALLALLWLALAPPTPDLAAQVYRASLFAREGFAIWDTSWYGGFHLPSYSLLFPPLGALLGPRLVGVIAVTASVLVFERLVRAEYGPRAGWVAALWFTVAALGDLLIGRITFSLGIAVGLLALLALQRGRPVTAGALGVACAAASPVAGVFLALAAFAIAVPGRSRAALATAAAAGGTVLALALAFPAGGRQPYTITHAVIPLAVCAAMLVVAPRRERALRLGAVLYAIAIAGALVVPSPVGSNIARLGVLFGGPLLAAVAIGVPQVRVRAGAFAAVVVALGLWQLFGPVREVAKGVGDPSTQAAYYAPLIAELRARTDAPARVEVPFTRGHWEAAHLAPHVPLARGWLTQLDVKYGAFFYRRERPFAAATYRDWLRRSGVRFVAVPDAAPDPSSRRALDIIATGPAWLRPVWSNRHWRLYELADPRPLVDGPARLVRLRHDSFTLDVRRPRPLLVRVRHSPYLVPVGGAACITRAPGGWTRVAPLRRGTLRVEARFDAARIVSHGTRCDAGDG